MYASKLLSAAAIFAGLRGAASTSHASQRLHPRLASGDNIYAIQYLCLLGGWLEPNAAQAAQGCTTTEYAHEDWLVEMMIGSAQNGSQLVDRNPWDFSLRTIADLIGDVSGMEVWDWTFTSAGPIDDFENLGFGAFQVLNLTANGAGAPPVTKIDVGGSPGFTASGDQTGYVGSKTTKNSARIEPPGMNCLTNSASPSWVYWNNTNQWNWTLSFTNDTANFSLFTSQVIGALSLRATCQRMLNATPHGEGTYPTFAGEQVELWTNGTDPMFHNWNSSRTYPMPASAAAASLGGLASQAGLIVFAALVGSWAYLL